MDQIDFSKPEDSKVKRRPFSVNVEEDVARAFIRAVKSNGWYVRETMVKLMREFAVKFTKETVEDVANERK